MIEIIGNEMIIHWPENELLVFLMLSIVPVALTTFAHFALSYDRWYESIKEKLVEDGGRVWFYVIMSVPLFWTFLFLEAILLAP